MLLVHSRSACTCTCPVVCYILQEIHWCTWSFLPAGLFLLQGFFRLILLPSPPPYASFSTYIFTVTGAFCFLMSGVLMAGLHHCASHKGIHQSGDGLPKVEAPGYSRHVPNLHLTMQLLMLSVNNALQDYKDSKCQFQYLTLFKIANQRTEHIKQNEHVSSYLNDNQKADTRAKIRRVTIHSSHNIHHRLANGNNHAKY